jgi:Mlc titration factor MtfA (ptsG expression regulator)
MFSWFKRRRRQKLWKTEFPPAWEEILQRNLPRFGLFTPEEQQRLRNDLRVFVVERTWESLNSIVITDEMKVTIAAHACTLLMNLQHDYFSHVPSILVTPQYFAVSGVRRHKQIPGLVQESKRVLAGEAMYRGPVKLSWDDVLEQSLHPEYGRNLVHHEFSHQLDSLDGFFNGTPLLDNPQQYQHWRDVMQAQFDQLQADLAARLDTVIDPYGAKDEAEFFAVTTEAFFNDPIDLQIRHGQLYDLFSGYYKQDPAARLRQAGESSQRG